MRTLALRGWGSILSALHGISVLVLAFMMLSICYDTFMRYTFAAPTNWGLEVNSFLIVYLAVMTAAENQRTDGHLRITFFTDKVPPRLQALSAIVTGVLGIGFSGVMAWRGGLTAFEALEYGERVSSAFGTPMAIPYALLPIGFGLLAVQFVPQVVRSFGEFVHSGAQAH